MAPPLEPLTFEDVTKVYREEKKSTGLTSIRHDFYGAVRTLMDQLKRDYEKEAVNDSYSAKARQLSQSIAKMREKVLQIFDMRADKVMHMAILGAAGGKVDRSWMTEEERHLLDSALAQATEMRNGLLDMPRPGNLEFTRMSALPMPASVEEAPKLRVEELAPVKQVETAPATGPIEEPSGALEAAVAEASPSMGGQVPIEVASSTPEVSSPSAEFVLLRILEDIPPFAGPSGTYRLGKEEIVTLPASIGKALVKRGKAMEIAVGSF